VTWWKIDVPKDAARKPVEAFAMTPIAAMAAGRDEEKNK
jgi:hypothetical protein